MLLAAPSLLDYSLTVTLTANTAVLVPVPQHPVARGFMVYTSAAVAITGGQTSSTAASTSVSSITGGIGTGGTITGGSLYTNAVYPNVPITGGSGSGAIGTVTISGGAFTAITITTPGSGYTTSDTGLSFLAANVGGTGSGALFNVASLSAGTQIFTASSIFLPAAGQYQFSAVATTFISLKSAGTPTVTITFVKDY